MNLFTSLLMMFLVAFVCYFCYKVVINIIDRLKK